MDNGLPMMFGNIVAAKDKSDVIHFVGGSPSTPTSIYKWSLTAREPATQLACSTTLSFPEDVISTLCPFEFPTTFGTAYGYYYLPCNNEFESTTESAPPLLVLELRLVQGSNIGLVRNLSY